MKYKNPGACGGGSLSTTSLLRALGQTYAICEVAVLGGQGGGGRPIDTQVSRAMVRLATTHQPYVIALFIRRSIRRISEHRVTRNARVEHASSGAERNSHSAQQRRKENR
jgi:hypothetical protein